jgi:hypothetical protein
MPSDTRYFPTEDPNWYIACDFNPQDGQYNLNRRRIPASALPQPGHAGDQTASVPGATKKT